MKKLLVSMLALLTFAAMSIAVPISDVQQFGEEGEMYLIEGCVTAITGAGDGGFFLQDAEAAWSGIQVYGSNVGIEVGMTVMVNGEMTEYYDDWTELLVGEDYPGSFVDVMGTGCVINPITPTIGEAFDEPYEGVLCSFFDVMCTAETSGYGEWEISDGTDFGFIDDMLLYPDTFYAVLGQCYHVTGIMYFSYGNFKLEPRNFGEIVETACTLIEPSNWSLDANYPNPFNPTTTINFSIAEPCQVSLSVFNMAGQQVATLVNSDLSAGTHSVNFDGSNLTSGIYFYMLQAGDFTATHKMVLVK